MPHTQPWYAYPANGPFLRAKAAAEYLGVSVSQLYVMASSGTAPRPFKINAGVVGLPKSWLDLLISERASEALEAAQ